MKIIIAIAILLNTYGVLSSSVESDKHKHHHKHHNDNNYVNELTVDELADVLLSLPGSLGRQAYRTFLSLGEFLPVETKAHKFFTSIPKAIRRKSKGEISELRRIPRPQPSSLSSNPIFMVQPAGYHMLPLPLHPMFSSSPLDFFTRVPCAHTKVIRVPLHTFDVKISSVTRKLDPTQNSFDGLEGFDDNDDDDDESNFNDEDELNKLLDLFASANPQDEDKEVKPSLKPEENEAEQSSKQDEDKATQLPKQEDEKTESLKQEDAAKVPPKQEDEVAQSSNQEEVTRPSTQEEEITGLPKQDEKVTHPKEESVEEKDKQEQQSSEPSSLETSQGKKYKKSQGKKGNKAAVDPEKLDSPTEDVLKPIPGKKPRKKRDKQESQ